MLDTGIILAFFDGLTPYEQGRIVGQIIGALSAAFMIRFLYKKFG